MLSNKNVFVRFAIYFIVLFLVGVVMQYFIVKDLNSIAWSQEVFLAMVLAFVLVVITTIRDIIRNRSKK